MISSSRRKFIGQVAAAAGSALISPSLFSAARPAMKFEISLAEWSLHKSLFAKKIDNLDFPGIARKTYGIGVVEYVNAFFKDKAEDTKYLNELLKRCSDNDIKNHLIMIDSEGELANTDNSVRQKSVENHYKWVHAAKHLGCATIRVNAFGKGGRAAIQQAAIEGLGALGEYASKENINVVVENHGGYSSNGQWMADIMKSVNLPNVGMLPDFGNFCMRREGGGEWEGKCIEEYDKYKGVQELMPYAKGVSAKTFDFDNSGNCVETDYPRMMKIIQDSGFKGYFGIEYEGERLSEDEGIKKTKALLQRFQH